MVLAFFFVTEKRKWLMVLPRAKPERRLTLNFPAASLGEEREEKQRRQHICRRRRQQCNGTPVATAAASAASLLRTRLALSGLDFSRFSWPVITSATY